MSGEVGARLLALAAIVLALLAIVVVWNRAEPLPPLAPLAWRELAPPADAPAREWRWIVIHHSGARTGTPAGIDHDHEQVRKWEGIGYHFVIGNGNGMPLGRVEATFRWRGQRQGAHATSEEHNQHGIGICLIGNFSLDHPDPRQLGRAIDLCALLIQHVPGLAVERIVGHADVKPGKDGRAATECPGLLFDLDGFRARVGERLRDRLTLGIP